MNTLFENKLFFEFGRIIGQIKQQNLFIYFIIITGAMTTPSASWMREFNEASKLGDEINGMISGKNSLPSSGPETQRHLSASRRKITILRTKLDILQSLLSELPSKQPM